MRPRLTSSLLVAAGLLLAGCASVPDGAREAEAYACPLGTPGCDENRPVGEGGDLTIVSSREGEFSFTVIDGITVTGEVAVYFVNEGAGIHNVEFLGAADGSQVVEAQGGAEAEGVAQLFPGETVIICNISGHREQGMEARVRVFATPEEAAAAEAEAEADAEA